MTPIGLLFVLGTACAANFHYVKHHFKFEALPLVAGECVETRIDFPGTEMYDLDFTHADCINECPSMDLSIEPYYRLGWIWAKLCAREDIGWVHSLLIPLEYHCIVPWWVERTVTSATSNGTHTTLRVGDKEWTFDTRHFGGAGVVPASYAFHVRFWDGTPAFNLYSRDDAFLRQVLHDFMVATNPRYA